MLYKPTYELTYRNQILDISKLVDSRETKIVRHLCTTEFKSAIDTASIVVRYSPDEKSLRATIMNFIYGSMETLDDIEVNISLNSYSLFKGYLDLSELKLSSKRLPELIQLQANDISAKLLDRRVDEYIYLEGKKVSEIVKHLIALAGGTFNLNFMQQKDDWVIPVFAVDKDEDKETFRYYIDTLLFEAGGYVLDTDEKGMMSIQALPWESFEPTRIVNDYQLAKGIETTRRWIDKDGLEVIWSTLAETNSDQRVWTANFQRDFKDDLLTGVDVPPGGYFPEDGDVVPTYQKFNADLLDRKYLTKQSRLKNEDLSIIAVRDVTAQIATLDSKGRRIDNAVAWDYPILPSLKMSGNPTIYTKKAWYLLHNKTNQILNLQIFSLEGRVLYRSKVNHLTVPASASKLQEYTSTYIFNEEHAKRFAHFYWHFLKYSSTIHHWSVLGDVSLGDVVGIQHKGASKSQATLIVSAALSFVGNTSKVDCTGVAVGAYEEYVVESYSDEETVKPPVKNPAITMQLSGLTYRYDSKGKLLPGNKIITAEVKNVNKYSPIHWKINGVLLDTQETVIDVPPTYMTNRDFIDIEVSLGTERVTNSIVRVMDGADYIPIIQYRYSSNADTPDIDYKGINFKTATDTYAIAFKGTRVVYGDEPWTATVPVGEKYRDKYLWKRTWSYKENTWLYERVNDVYKIFDVYPTSYTYPINQRATEDIEIGFTTRIQGFSGSVSFSASVGLFRESVLILPSTITASKVEVRVRCGDIVRIIELLGVATEDNSPVFGGILDAPPTDKNPIEGDYYMSSTGVPMRYDALKKEWIPLTPNDINESDIMDTCGKAWVSSGHDIDDVHSAIYAYYEQLYSTVVVSDSIDTDRLMAKKLGLKSGGSIYGGGFNENGEQIKIDEVTGLPVPKPKSEWIEGIHINDRGGLKAYNAQIYGSVESDAFKTLNSIDELTVADVDPIYQEYWNNADSLVRNPEIKSNWNYKGTTVKSNYQPAEIIYAFGRYWSFAYRVWSDGEDSHYEILGIISSKNLDTWNMEVDYGSNRYRGYIVLYGNTDILYFRNGDIFRYTTDGITWNVIDAEGCYDHPRWNFEVKPDGYVFRINDSRSDSRFVNGLTYYCTNNSFSNWVEIKGSENYSVIKDAYGNGRIVAYISANENWHSTSGMFYSDDHGISWTKINDVYPDDLFRGGEYYYYRKDISRVQHLFRSKNGIDWEDYGIPDIKMNGFRHASNRIGFTTTHVSYDYLHWEPLPFENAFGVFSYTNGLVIYSNIWTYYQMCAADGYDYCQLFSPSKISSFFSNIRPKITNSKKVPAFEPLVSMTGINARLIAENGRELVATEMEVGSNYVHFRGNGFDKHYSAYNPMTDNIILQELIIPKINSSVTSGDMFPMNENVTLGSSKTPFEKGYFQHLFVPNIKDFDHAIPGEIYKASDGTLRIK